MKKKLTERFIANDKHWEDRTRDRITSITFSDDPINNTFFSVYTDMSAEQKESYKEEVLNLVKKLVNNFRIKATAGHDKKRVSAVEFAVVKIINSKEITVDPVFVDAEGKMKGNKWVAASNNDRLRTLMLFPAKTPDSSILRQVVSHYNRTYLDSKESAVDLHEADYIKAPSNVITINIDDIVNPKEEVKKEAIKLEDVPYKVLADYIKDSKGRPKKITFLKNKREFMTLPVIDSGKGTGGTTGKWDWVIVKPKSSTEIQEFRKFLDENPKFFSYDRITEKIKAGEKEVTITTAFKLNNLYTLTALNNGMLKEDYVKGGLADDLSLEEVVIHHVLNQTSEPISQVTLYDEYLPLAKEQFQKGLEVEKEHSSDPNIIQEIVLDHLFENLFYYDELKG